MPARVPRGPENVASSVLNKRDLLSSVAERERRLCLSVLHASSKTTIGFPRASSRDGVPLRPKVRHTVGTVSRSRTCSRSEAASARRARAAGSRCPTSSARRTSARGTSPRSRRTASTRCRGRPTRRDSSARTRTSSDSKASGSWTSTTRASNPARSRPRSRLCSSGAGDRLQTACPSPFRLRQSSSV